MNIAEISRLEVPEVTDEALEKGAELSRWLDNIRSLPHGVAVMGTNSIEFSLPTTHFSGDRPAQCAVIIPGEPLSVTRVMWQYTKDRTRVDERKKLDDTTDPVIVGSFSFDDDFLLAHDNNCPVPLEAESVRWVPDGLTVARAQLYEIYRYDPSVHRLAVIDGWHDPRHVG